MTQAEKRILARELATLKVRCLAAQERLDSGMDRSEKTVRKYQIMVSALEQSLFGAEVTERHREHIRRISRELDHQHRLNRLTRSAYIELNRVISDDGGDTDG